MRSSTAVFILLTLGACHSMTSPGQLELGRSYSVEATVRFLDIEGGCWALETKQYGRVEPMGLDSSYKKDGLKVNVVLKIRNDVGSICMVGPIVSVEQISLQ